MRNFFSRQGLAAGTGLGWVVGYAVGVLVLVGVLVVSTFTLGADSPATVGQQPQGTASPHAGEAVKPSPGTSGSPGASRPAIPAETSVRIATGDTGLTVARKLAKAHVVASSETFYELLLEDETAAAALQPGTYTLRTRLTPEAALSALGDPANRVQLKLVVPEGFTAAQVYARAAKLTGLPVSAFTQAAKTPTKLGVPKTAPNVEGWLFPATYTFEPDASATDILDAMVQRTHQALDEAGLGDASSSRQQEVLTLASIVQKESGSTADDAKVARVFTNRLAKKMPLQSDATVSYGAAGSTVIPTKGEYASKNPYNTYLRQGLPAGPISNPGDAAIEAALHPAQGPWLYFVTVDLQSGRTVFSTTLKQHEAAVAEFRAWLKAHPSYR
jgi:UPF0755 protein